MSKNAEREKENAIKFAKQIGMSEEEFDKKVEEFVEEMRARNIPEEELEFYTYKRMNKALKLRIYDAQFEAEGFAIAQKPAIDFARFPREEIDKFVWEKGIEMAVELGVCNADLIPLKFQVDEKNQPVMEGGVKEVGPLSKEEVKDYITKLGTIVAQEAGKIDKDGNYLYSDNAVPWKQGKIIPQHEYQGTVYGLFQMPGDNNPKVTEITIKGEAALETIPLFKMIRIPAKTNVNKSNSQKNVLTTQRSPSFVGEDVDYLEYDDIFRTAYPDKRLDSLDEIDEFLDSHEKYDWCIVDADIVEVGTTISDFGSIPVTIANIAASSRQQIKEITLWADAEQARGLIETSDAVIVLSPRAKEDGTIGGTLLGCYIDPYFRPTSTPRIDENGVLDPF